MIIIGVDPGIATTGYGVIKKFKTEVKCLKYGVITTSPSNTPEQRLRKLHLELAKLLRKYNPKVLVTEYLYFFKNSKTAIQVGEARGIILLTAAKKRVRVEQYTPLQVKMTICGYGRATKQQVQKMVKEIMKLKEIPKPDDAADALALAFCQTIKKGVDKGFY